MTLGVTPESPEAGGAQVASAFEASATLWRLAVAHLRHDRRALIAAVVLGMIVVLALLAPLLASSVVHHGPNEQFLRQATDLFGLPKGPSRSFWFGADRLGRDEFVRTLYGARTSLIVASLATIFQIVVAIAVGVPAGYFGGAVDNVLSRLTDVALALPATLLILGLVTACSGPAGCASGIIRPGIPLVAFVLGAFGWMIEARVIRARTLSLREQDFVGAARIQGVSAFRVMVTEILPNLTVQVIVLTTLLFPANVLGEAALSFLGVGVPPTTPSWGAMLEDANQLMTVAWWMMVFPGLFLFATTMSFNIVGESVRTALDPSGEHAAAAI
jgi:peptide/nickel transport system permease protein